jgi:hypothetical protein
MALDDVLRCQHIKINGTQCGSPALRRRRRCYFHEGARCEQRRIVADPSTKRGFELPLLEDANAVQIGLMRVIQWLGSGQMEPRIAGLMLYALQTASCNLKNVNFEAAKPTDVVIDRSTMDQTCINGPQWFPSDFVLQVEEEKRETGDAIAASAGQASPAEASPVEPRRESRQVRRARARAALRKRPSRAEVEETPSLARDFLRRVFPNGIPNAPEARVGQG